MEDLKKRKRGEGGGDDRWRSAPEGGDTLKIIRFISDTENTFKGGLMMSLVVFLVSLKNR